ncbi:hypothetical protein [Humidesulfovibrio mexicanus]|uniref:hypothetical protein n=1 Tax=Humidesulfovibrio mexicanus TaxID=147047 RepID=UPI000B791EA5|nr:hypothetical protein [Humidesulfovibrio mexicanus]
MNAPTMATAQFAAAATGVAASSTAAARPDEDLCPLCDKHCPLSAPSCRKGRAYAASHAAGGQS